jgi:hypothetical protein
VAVAEQRQSQTGDFQTPVTDRRYFAPRLLPHQQRDLPAGAVHALDEDALHVGGL